VDVNESEVSALVAGGYLPEKALDDAMAIKAAIECVISDLAFELEQERSKGSGPRFWDLQSGVIKAGRLDRHLVVANGFERQVTPETVGAGAVTVAVWAPAVPGTAASRYDEHKQPHETSSRASSDRVNHCIIATFRIWPEFTFERRRLGEAVTRSWNHDDS
jgi:hypothetical protein